MLQRAAIRTVFFVDGLILAKWLPHLPDIQARLDLNLTHLGIVLAAIPLGIIAALPFVGPALVARWSERTAITAALLWLVMTSAFAGLAPNEPLLALGLFLFGTAVGTVEVVMNAAADSIERRSERRLMSSCHGWWAVGNISGVLVGALALGAGQDARVSLTVAAVPLAIIVILLGLAMSPLRPAAAREKARFTLPGRSLLLLCLLPFCACVLEGAMADWAAVYLHTEYLLEGPVLGAGFGVFATVMAATRLFGDRLIDRFGPPALARACGVFGILGLTTLALAVAWPMALVGFACMGLAASLVFPMSITAAAAHPSGSASENIAVLSIVCFSGYLVGPPVMGLLAGQFGLRTALLVLLPMALGVVILAGRAAQRTVAAPAGPVTAPT